jgi:HAD superfamily hydrolase (TIGR01509 family)
MHHRPTGLATNAERANADFVLDGAGLRRYFRAIADGSQVKNAKPAADIYELVARELGVHPRNCIVFEDSKVGVAAARAAGTRVVGIQTQIALLEGVDILVPDFSSADLADWLGQQQVKA